MASPFVMLQRALPHHAVSRFAGRFASSTRPALKNALIRRFIAAYDVDMSEAARNVDEYASFNDFFTRELKPGARPLADAATRVLASADGTISQIGTVTDGKIFQAKGKHFTTAQLLGDDSAAAERFEGGSFVTIYLSPRDYHRVHMPAAGALSTTTYVPGDLFSVNDATAQDVNGLFARNERLACLFEGDVGCFASVMVGAMIVAGIETVWGADAPTHSRKVRRNTYDDVRLDAGAEMGRFILGSTSILLFEPGAVTWDAELGPGSTVRMGQALGQRA